jgi:hypothetical protein
MSSLLYIYGICTTHRYLMTRLSLQVASYIMVVKFRNTIWPPPPQFSLHRRAALSSNSNGTRSYIAENPKRSLYCEMSVVQPWSFFRYRASSVKIWHPPRTGREKESESD